MPTLNRSSAVIYQFPIGGRAGLRPTPARAESNLPKVTFGSGWYHDEAIEEDAQEQRHRH